MGDFGPISESIFEFLLHCSRERPTLQKPWFFASRLLQEPIYAFSRFLHKSHENHAKITPTMLSDRLAQKILSFLALGRDLASILVTSAHPWTLLGAPCAQARPIFAAWTHPDRPTSIDLGVSGNPKRSTSVDLGTSTGPALARTTCHGPIDPAGSTWLHRSGHVATA